MLTEWLVDFKIEI